MKIIITKKLLENLIEGYDSEDSVVLTLENNSIFIDAQECFYDNELQDAIKINKIGE